MNTKQIEELTGISRQNIRYYERMGLLQPKRDEGNKYRDYSEDDVGRLKMIKMLRMLDMPIEEIGKVIHRETTLHEAIEVQKEELVLRQKQLQAAIDMCGRIEKSEKPEEQVEQYLNEMEYLQTRKGGFAQIVDDYRQIAAATEQKQFTFQVPYALHSDEDIWRELVNYGDECGLSFLRVKGKIPLTVKVDDIEYEVYTIRTHHTGDGIPATAVVCTMCHPETAQDAKIPPGRKKVMQTVYEVFRNVRRQRWKSVLAAGVCAVMVCFMALYMGNLDSNKKQLRNLPNVYEITGEVKNPTGSQSKGILIPEELTAAVKESAYIKAYKETISMSGTYDQVEIRVIGANCLSAAENLLDRDVDWAQGSENLTFFSQGGGCIADEMFMMNHGLELGDEIQTEIQYYGVEERKEDILVKYPLEAVGLKIIGSTELKDNDLICPLTDVKKWFEESGAEYLSGSAAFTLKEPETMNRFKQDMINAGFLETSATAKMSYIGNRLVIDDLDYITSAQNLRKSIGFLTGFYPLLLVLVLLMGYMVSWILMQSRRLELAIMKSLGSGNLRITVQVFAEQMFLAAAGCICGIAINIVFGWGSGITLLKIAGLFIICYGIGTVISLGFIRRIGVMGLLSGKE